MTLFLHTKQLGELPCDPAPPRYVWVDVLILVILIRALVHGLIDLQTDRSVHTLLDFSTGKAFQAQAAEQHRSSISAASSVCELVWSLQFVTLEKGLL